MPGKQRQCLPLSQSRGTLLVCGEFGITLDPTGSRRARSYLKWQPRAAAAQEATDTRPDPRGYYRRIFRDQEKVSPSASANWTL